MSRDLPKEVSLLLVFGSLSVAVDGIAGPGVEPRLEPGTLPASSSDLTLGQPDLQLLLQAIFELRSRLIERMAA
jgi:hypothetical protein